MPVCAAADCDQTFTPKPDTPHDRQRFCSEQCRRRTWYRGRFTDPEFREAEQARHRDAYYELDGLRYSRRLLLGRRRKALVRLSERHRSEERPKED